MARSAYLVVCVSFAACGGTPSYDDEEVDASAGGGGSDAAAPSGDAGAGGSDAGGGGSDATLGTAGEPPELSGILAAHNMVRANHGVAAMTWDPQLASIAQTWVNGCADTQAPSGLIDGDPNRSASYGSYVGENVFGSTAASSGLQVVMIWASEESDYDYASNTCASGQSCGSYTQIVWAASTKLGCAVHMCPGITYGWSVICNYAPGGNDGSRPY